MEASTEELQAVAAAEPQPTVAVIGEVVITGIRTAGLARGWWCAGCATSSA